MTFCMWQWLWRRLFELDDDDDDDDDDGNDDDDDDDGGVGLSLMGIDGVFAVESSVNRGQQESVNRPWSGETVLQC